MVIPVWYQMNPNDTNQKNLQFGETLPAACRGATGATAASAPRLRGPQPHLGLALLGLRKDLALLASEDICGVPYCVGDWTIKTCASTTNGDIANDILSWLRTDMNVSLPSTLGSKNLYLGFRHQIVVINHNYPRIRWRNNLQGLTVFMKTKGSCTCFTHITPLMSWAVAVWNNKHTMDQDGDSHGDRSENIYHL